MEEMVKAKAIIQDAAYNFGLKCLTGDSRQYAVVRERGLLIYRLRQETDLTLAEIGELLGGRSPATVTHGYQKMAAGIGLCG